MIEMTELLRFARIAGWFMGAEMRRKVADVREEVAKLVRDVDRFYELLGPRNWVYFDFINLTAVERILASQDADEAERRLEEHLSDVEALRVYVRRCRFREGMRPRGQLLERALIDQAEGRYYAVVLVLLAVMDGFVNDLNPANRKGLHSRDPKDMVGWDSVVSHHYGLSHAHASFVKPCFKTTEEETTELHRHGLVHGTIVNYDNPTIAAKAWCRLFAVVNWAESLEKQQKEAAKPPKPTSVREILRDLARDATEHGAEMKLHDEGIAAWSARTVSPDDATFDNDDIKLATEKYLSAWKAKQVGIMADLMQLNMREETAGRTAGSIKADIADFDLSDFVIDGVAYTAPALAEATVSLVLNGETKPGNLEWVWEDANGRPVTVNVDGAWHLQNWGPWAITAPRRRPPEE